MNSILDPSDPTYAIEDGRVVRLRCGCGRDDCGARLDVDDNGELVAVAGARCVVPWWAPYAATIVLSTAALAGLTWWWWR